MVVKQRPCHCHQIMKTLVQPDYCINNDILRDGKFDLKGNEEHVGQLCGKE